MKLLVGTSGYSYKEWKGGFYPEDLGAPEMLSFYARKLPTVEINNTFYRMPSPQVLEQWSEQVPEDFVFVLKASRRITHQQRLSRCEDSVEYLLKTTGSLGKKLGPYLFQFPPHFKKNVEKLRAFLTLVPEDRKLALEFRHESWFDEEVYGALREHDAALCISDDNADEPEIVTTGSWGYLRLRKDEYPEEALKAWADRLRETSWDRTFVFFKHEEEGPALALRLLEVFGSP